MTSDVDRNTLYLDPDPEYGPNLDPDPRAMVPIGLENVKNSFREPNVLFKNNCINIKKIMAPE